MEESNIGVPVEKYQEVVEDGKEFVYEADAPPVPTKPEDVLLSDHLKGNKRLEGELYCDYRCRLWWENLAIKQYSAGRTIWIGKERGPMYNLDRVDRSSKTRNKKDAYNDRIDEIHNNQGFKIVKTRRVARSQ